MEQIKDTMVQKEGGARLQKKEGGSAGRGVLIALTAAVAVMAAGYTGLCAYARQTPDIWRGTEVLGQDIGGQTVEDAAGQISQVLETQGIGLYLYDSAAETPPDRGTAPDGAVPLRDLLSGVDVSALVKAADDDARSGPFLTAGFRYLTHSQPPYNGGGELRLVDSAARSALTKELANSLSVPVEDTDYTLEDGALRITLATDGRTVSPQVLQEALEEPSNWAGDLSLDIPYSAVSGQALTAQEIHDQVYGEMKNAGYDAATESIIPEVVGADFDITAAQAAIDGGAPGETVSVPAQIQEPVVTADTLRSVLFRDVLGEARTHVSGTAARRSNVALASSAFNGTVLNSGDIFSYNETVGQRTVAKGYKPAPAYVQGETVDEIGGGVCQPSSTLYLACLRANMEITERYAHRYVPAYIEKGMDATVSWGGPDYKFTNNTDYPIKLVAVYEGSYLTIRLLGTNVDGTYAKMTHEQLSSTAAQVVYEDDPTLPAGTETVKTTPYTGYRVKTYRHIYAADGTLLSSTYEATSDYKVRNKVILRGPAAEESPDISGGTDVPVQGPGTIVTPGEPITGNPQEPGDTTPVLPADPFPIIPNYPNIEPNLPIVGLP